jgi:hypothetical protein
MLHNREEKRKQLAIERQIDSIVGRTAVAKEDRALMTGMLRYMNLGPGRGQQWNAEQYARQSGDALADVIRCYRMLQNCSSVTADNARDLFARGTAGKVALEQRWRKSGYTDAHALRGLLVFERLQMSPALFAGLWLWSERQLPQEQSPYHWTRWFMVREGLRETGELKAAFAYASEKLAHAPARGGSKTMERSYYLIEHRKTVARNVRRYRKRRKP